MLYVIFHLSQQVRPEYWWCPAFVGGPPRLMGGPPRLLGGPPRLLGGPPRLLGGPPRLLGPRLIWRLAWPCKESSFSLLRPSLSVAPLINVSTGVLPALCGPFLHFVVTRLVAHACMRSPTVDLVQRVLITCRGLMPTASRLHIGRLPSNASRWALRPPLSRPPARRGTLTPAASIGAASASPNPFDLQRPSCCM